MNTPLSTQGGTTVKSAKPIALRKFDVHANFRPSGFKWQVNSNEGKPELSSSASAPWTNYEQSSLPICPGGNSAGACGCPSRTVELTSPGFGHEPVLLDVAKQFGDVAQSLVPQPNTLRIEYFDPRAATQLTNYILQPWFQSQLKIAVKPIIPENVDALVVSIPWGNPISQQDLEAALAPWGDIDRLDIRSTLGNNFPQAIVEFFDNRVTARAANAEFFCRGQKLMLTKSVVPHASVCAQRSTRLSFSPEESKPSSAAGSAFSSYPPSTLFNGSSKPSSPDGANSNSGTQLQQPFQASGPGSRPWFSQQPQNIMQKSPSPPPLFPLSAGSSLAVSPTGPNSVTSSRFGQISSMASHHPPTPSSSSVLSAFPAFSQHQPSILSSAFGGRHHQQSHQQHSQQHSQQHPQQHPQQQPNHSNSFLAATNGSNILNRGRRISPNFGQPLAFNGASRRSSSSMSSDSAGRKSGLDSISSVDSMSSNSTLYTNDAKDIVEHENVLQSLRKYSNEEAERHLSAVGSRPGATMASSVVGSTPVVLPNNRLKSHHHHKTSDSSSSTVSSSTKDKDNTAIDLTAIELGKEKRTTVMVRNIPNKLEFDDFKRFVDQTNKNTYDFLYLRFDFSNRCNVGYAFISFTSPQHVKTFVKSRTGMKWTEYNYNSEKVIEIRFARIQGCNSLIEKFRNSPVMHQEMAFRPRLYHTNGGLSGQEKPFPVTPPQNAS